MSRTGPADDTLSQLSLFDAPAPIEPSSPTPAPARTIVPRAAVDRPVNSTPEFDAIPPAPPARAPLHSRPPGADREVRLGEHVVGFALRRARRSSIGFVVSGDGLQVNAP